MVYAIVTEPTGGPSAGGGPFRVVTADFGGAVEVRLQGELDITGAEALWSSVAPVLHDARRQGPLSLTLDMTELAFLDAAGLGHVVRLANEVCRRGGDVQVRRPDRPLVRRVLELGCLTEGRGQRPSVAPPVRPGERVAPGSRPPSGAEQP